MYNLRIGIQYVNCDKNHIKYGKEYSVDFS